MLDPQDEQIKNNTPLLRLRFSATDLYIQAENKVRNKLMCLFDLFTSKTEIYVKVIIARRSLK